MNRIETIDTAVPEQRLRGHAATLAGMVGERTVRRPQSDLLSERLASDTPESIVRTPMARGVDGRAKAIGLLAALPTSA